MRFIEDLHNIHKGEEIWVLGTGPSLDDFPDNFFDEKYRIAIPERAAIVAFPNCTYSAFPLGNKTFLKHIKHLIEKEHYLHKCIVILGKKELEKKAFIGTEPIYLRSGNFHLLEHHSSMGMKDNYEEFFSSLAKNLFNGVPMPYACEGTSIHAVVQAAIVMGAKKVTLAGCEAKTLKFQGHAYKRGLDKIYKEQDRIPKNGFSSEYTTGRGRGGTQMRAGTAFLAKIMEPYGVQVTRYFYGKGYEPVDTHPYEKHFFQRNIHIYGDE